MSAADVRVLVDGWAVVEVTCPDDRMNVDVYVDLLAEASKVLQRANPSALRLSGPEWDEANGRFVLLLFMEDCQGEDW